MKKTIKESIIDFIHYLATFKFWKELIIMTLGMMVTAAAVYYFLVPSKLIIGTISGLSIVLSNIFGGSLGIWIMGINILLLILAFLLIGNEFGAKTVYTALILGPLTDFWDWIYPWQNIASPNPVTGTPSVMGDPWFDLCCFVLLLSASQALMFSINASTGGLDILAKIVNKYLHFDIRCHHLLYRLLHQPFPYGRHRTYRHMDQRACRGLLHRSLGPAQTCLHCVERTRTNP